MEKRENIDTGQIIQDYLASTEGERYDKGVNIIIELCDKINLLNHKIERIEETHSWGEIKRKFFETEDLLDKLLIIENFIADNKIYIENTYNLVQKEGTEINQKVNDKIKNLFNDLKKMSRSIVSLECTTLKGAKVLYDDRSTKYKDFKKDYNRNVLSLVSIFSDVYEIYTVLRAKKQEKREAHERSKDKLETMGRYGIPYQKQVAKDVDAEYDEDENILMPDNKKFQKKLWPEGSIENQNQKKMRKRNARNY